MTCNHFKTMQRCNDATMQRRNGQTGKRVVIAIAVLAIAMTGCSKETTLHSGLLEQQANLVMAALLDAGIGCRKAAGDEGTWNVMVDEAKFAQAVNLLEKAGLPRRPHQGIGEVFKKSGMISSPSEERIRFMDALAQDLAKTISGIEGVVDARVHIVLPENDPFARNTIPSSAAVAIRSRWDADLTDVIPSVKGLVKNAIEGLTAEKIMVTVFRDSPPKDR
jgi:type III secretion protein J